MLLLNSLCGFLVQIYRNQLEVMDQKVNQIQIIFLVLDMKVFYGLIHQIIYICLADLVTLHQQLMVIKFLSLVLYCLGYLNDLWKFDGTNWIWIAGSKEINQPGDYGTKGEPKSTNSPGARCGCVS